MSNQTNKWTPKYLHVVGHHVSYLDHRIVPELGACFAAMMSRVPKGGIMARYKEVVTKTAREMYNDMNSKRPRVVKVGGHMPKLPEWDDAAQYAWMGSAEERLTQYPLPLCVHNPKFDTKSYNRETKVDKNGEKPGFINLNVALYGHGSIKEMTGNPVVFVEHISWWFAYLTFDNPLVSGQEMSTRAVWRRDWPMAVDGFSRHALDAPGGPNSFPGEGVEEMHNLGLEIAWHETEAWKVELKSDCPGCNGNGYHHNLDDGPVQPIDNLLAMEESGIRGIMWCSACDKTGKKYPWMNDPQAFRPAFDRSRHTLPGTFETGVAHTASVRVMGRVLKVMRDLATASGQQSALAIIGEMETAYSLAIPGMAGMWLREAVHDDVGKQAGKTRIINELTKLQENGSPVSLDALNAATVSTLGRRAGSVLHIKPKEGERWDSSREEIGEIASLFTTTEEAVHDSTKGVSALVDINEALQKVGETIYDEIRHPKKNPIRPLPAATVGLPKTERLAIKVTCIQCGDITYGSSFCGVDEIGNPTCTKDETFLPKPLLQNPMISDDNNPYLHDPIVDAMLDVFVTTPFTVTKEAADVLRDGSMPEDSEIGEHIPDIEGSAYLEEGSQSAIHSAQPDGTPWTQEAIDNTPWVPLDVPVAGESTNVTESKAYDSVMNMRQGMAGISSAVIRPDEIDDHMKMVRSGVEKNLGLPEGALDALGVPDKFLEGSTEFSTHDMAMRDKHLFTIMSVDGVLKSGEGEFIGWAKNLKEVQTAGTNQTSLTMTVARNSTYTAGMVDRLIDQDYPMEIHTLEYVYRGCWASLCTGIEIDKGNGVYADCDVQYVSKEKWDNSKAENDALEETMVKQDGIILGEISQSLLSAEAIEALDDLHSAVVDGKRYSTNEAGRHAVSVGLINIVHDEVHATIQATDTEDLKEKITDLMNERSPEWDRIAHIPTDENIYLPTGTPQKPVNTFREAQAMVDERERRRTAMGQLPGNISFLMAGNIHAKDGPDTEVCITTLRDHNDLKSANVKHRRTRREYVDDYFNAFARVDMTIRCSSAAARDWHRHRTAMPWQIRVVRNNEGSIAHLDNGTTMMMNLVAGTLVRGDTVTLGGDKLLVVRVEKLKGPLQIDHHYAPISEFGKANHARYMEMCTALFDKYMAEGNQWMAMLCLPLGTRVEMKGQAGLKDAIYLNELRGWVAGGNFEYKEQARSMMGSITTFIKSMDSDLLMSALALDQDLSDGEH